MAFCGVCVASSSGHYPLLHNLNSSRRPTISLLNPPSLSSSSTSYSSCVANGSEGLQSRRAINISFVGILLSRFLFVHKALAEPALELERYIDSKEGFTLLIPSSWIKVDKAGATVLFEDSSKKANNVGVVVAPTRISSLGEFGTPQFVVDKLIQAEKRKESTKEAQVISVSERSSGAGLQVYEFEYKIDSTRGGPKRVFSAAFVASKKLYLLNITNSDSAESPLDLERRNLLEQVLHSFDVSPSV